MKIDFIREDYNIILPLHESGDGWKLSRSIFSNDEEFLNKDEFIKRIKEAKKIELQAHYKIKNKSIYLFLPIYAFLVWGLPILVFSLVGNLFSKKFFDRFSSINNE